MAAILTTIMPRMPGLAEQPNPAAADPIAALLGAPADRRLALLHSGRPHPRWASRSILAQPVGYFRFTGQPGRGRAQWIGPAPCPVERFTDDPFADLRQLLAARPDALWVGYLSYDLGRWVEDLPQQATDDRGWPVIELGFCPGHLRYDTLTKQWQPIGENAPLPVEAPAKREAFTAGSAQSVFASRQAYQRCVQRVIDYIAAGDVFQVNLAQRFTAELRGRYPMAHRALFARLTELSPAWYGAYIELPGHGEQPGRVLASTSPELFLEVQGRRVVTRPIKGTRPASVPAAELRDSPKDQAELNMIVDLMRNDLGRVCRYGSVRVTEPRVIESHPTVHHGVSTIEGELREACDVVDLLRAAMPGGSVTGAPKVRAMQIIDELEPVRRGPYCGCIGYLSAHHSCLNIAIRTMLADPAHDRVDFSVGGGIVADSQPAAEYDETLDKAQAILRTLAG